MKNIFIANDGTQFDDEFEYIEYEWETNHIHLHDIEFYDENQLITNIFIEGLFFLIDKIVVKTEEALKYLHAFARGTGFSECEDITCPGTWVWKPYGNKPSLLGKFVLQK